MKPHTRRGHGRMRRHTSFTPFFNIPARTMENNVLKVLHFLSAADAGGSNLEGRVGPLFVPHPSKSSIETTMGHQL
eukprot:5288725-Amphidinium_carterae.1